MEGKTLLISLPAYNEAKVLGSVLAQIPKVFEGISQFEILVVNDGSTDNTVEVAKSAGASVISHPINIGLGGAIQTAREYALKNNFDVWVTLDADGQHDPKFIQDLIMPILNKKAQVVIGKREFTLKNSPLIRIIGNRILSLLTYLLSGVYSHDSQSGFRAFSYGAFSKLDLRLWGMEISSEIIMETGRQKLIYTEVPITSTYTNYSRRKGQSALNSLNILYALITRR